jgi:CheY-like chemotaxis protein
MNQKTKSESKHIVLTDNEPIERELFQIIVEEIKPPVIFTPVKSGKALLDNLQNMESLPDLIFLDIDMPGKNGIETLIEIKNHEKLSSLPVIMYSGNIDERTIDAAYYNGAQYYFLKPSDINQLQNTIQWLIENKHNFKKPMRHEFVIDSKKQF